MCDDVTVFYSKNSIQFNSGKVLRPFLVFWFGSFLQGVSLGRLCHCLFYKPPPATI